MAMEHPKYLLLAPPNLTIEAELACSRDDIFTHLRLPPFLPLPLPLSPKFLVFLFPPFPF